MALIPRSVEALIEEFGRLPGVGPRSAERLTFFLLRDATGQAERLGGVLGALRHNLTTCAVCHNLTDSELCVICDDSQRESGLLAIVEEPLDVVAIEKTGLFRGRYHVLGGVISPIDGIGPDQLTIARRAVSSAVGSPQASRTRTSHVSAPARVARTRSLRCGATTLRSLSL